MSGGGKSSQKSLCVENVPFSVVCIIVSVSICKSMCVLVCNALLRTQLVFVEILINEMGNIN